MQDITKRKEQEAQVLPVYGRKQMLLLADAYKQLASSFGKVQPDGEHSMDRREYIYKQQMADSERVMADRIREMAEQMSKLASEQITYRRPGKKEYRQLTTSLKKHGIYLKDIFYTQRETMVFCLTMKSRKNSDYTTEDVARILSEVFEMPITSARENLFFVAYEYDCYMFESLPKFSISTGMARAIKENETVSGDNYSFYDINAAQKAIILSDGAGSGAIASKDSEMVLEWAEKYFDTGFGATEVADMINGIFLAKAREQNMPTLDICMLDLQAGTASFIKYGTSDSYVVRDDEVFKIRNVGFPLGFCKSTENTLQPGKYCLESGDIVIMLSDGVTDALESEDELLNIIVGYNSANPTEIANSILASVIRRSGGHIRDDMTVLVAGIWE